MWRVFVLLFSCIHPNVDLLFAQSYQSFELEGLDRSDIFDGFGISGVAYVFQTSALPPRDNTANDLSQMIPVNRAAIHGLPDESERALIEMFYESEVEFEVESVSAQKHYGSGFVWRVQCSVFPSGFGGLTGAPYKYIGYVNADGSLIEPVRYLVSRSDIGNDSKVYSTLSFAELTKPKTDKVRIDGEEALRLARTKLETFCAEAANKDINLKARLHDQQLLDIPTRTENSGALQTTSVWKVRFLPNYNLDSEDRVNNSINMWVVDNGVVSELSLNSWQAKDKKRLEH
jgi:hypothetical protein